MRRTNWRWTVLLGVIVGTALGLAALGVGFEVGGQAPGLEPQVSDLSAMEPNAAAVWQASYRTTAAQVAAMLPGLDALWRWDGRRWEPYAPAVDGAPPPGAVNFTIETGDRLWIGDFDRSRMPAGEGATTSASTPEGDPAPAGVVIAEGHRRGLVADRAVVGDPDAPVLIVDYGDFL